MKHLEILFLSFVFLFIVGCSSPDDYLNDAMDILEENSINKSTINWDKLRSEVQGKGKNAKTIKETHPAIRYALSQLNDKHSTFMTAEEYKNFNRPDLTIPEIKTVLYNNDIGYLRIPGFRGNGEIPSEKFAKQIQNKIKALDQFNIEYWIIDLSSDSGGFVWPMICGLGPLFGDGVLGYLVDADDNYFNWGYSDGEVFHKNERVMKLENPYLLKKKIVKLVVIIGEKTASAGEAIAISFKGADNTWFIGSDTWGVSTGNKGFILKDGALINLTTSRFADRDKSIYGASIKPDLEVSYSKAIETAINLIKEK